MVNSEVMLKVLTTIAQEGQVDENGNLHLDKCKMMIYTNHKYPEKAPGIMCNLQENEDGSPKSFDRIVDLNVEQWFELVYAEINKSTPMV